MDNEFYSQIINQIGEIQVQCREYETESEIESTKENEKIETLLKEINNNETEIKKQDNDIENLQKDYEKLQNYQKMNNEEVINSKEKELNQIKQKNVELKRQLDTLKQQCDLFKDQTYLSNIILYWTPQAMFKYIQAYDRLQIQNKN